MSNSDATYSVVVFNKLQEGAELESTREKLMSLLKVTAERVDSLFANERSVVKKGLDAEDADRYHRALQKTGILVEIEETLVEPPPLSIDLPDESAIEEVAEQVLLPESADVSEQQVFCRRCGARIAMSAGTCGACGSPQLVGKPRSKGVAATLALLCGGLGVHRFYLGQWWGIFYMLLWPLSSIFSIGEAIVFACSKRESWERKYGNVMSGMNAGIIIAVVFVFIFITGILAAIAIPAYQDYAMRAKVVQAMPFIEKQVSLVEGFVQKTGFIPNQNLDAGLPEHLSEGSVEGILIKSGGEIQATFSSQAMGGEAYTLIFKPTWQKREASWRCDIGTLPDKWRPKKCRANSSNVNVGDSALKLTSTSGLVAIELPSGWNSTTELHDDSVIQAFRGSDEQYLIVIEESKLDLQDGTTLADYNNIIINQMYSALDGSRAVGSPKNQTINGHAAISQEFTGSSEGVKIHYAVTSVETVGHFYQVIFWTLPSQIESSRGVFKSALQSFRSN